ncbi:uncharacterized protein METZ01_LOCUS349886, partial [marine metagenome]
MLSLCVGNYGKSWVTYFIIAVLFPFIDQ